MTFVMSNKKPAKVQVQFTDMDGDPAAVDGAVSWSSSNTDIATVVPMRPDSTIAVVTPVGPSGSFTLEAVADADLGDGLRRLTVTLSAQVVGGGTAVGGSIVPIRDVHPDQGLPSGGHPDNSLPPSPGRPDNSLPPSPGRPDNSLPGAPGHPDNTLPPDPAKPDNSLPPVAKPKK